MANTTDAITTKALAINDKSNIIRKLEQLIDPEIINIIRDEYFFVNLEPPLLSWWVNTLAKSPFLNVISFHIILSIQEANLTNTFTNSSELNTFLRWAIPSQYNSIKSMNTTKAIISYFGNPPSYRGAEICTIYRVNNRYSKLLLKTISKEKKRKLQKYILPEFTSNKRILILASMARVSSRKKRKANVFPLIDALPRLIIESRKRYLWLEGLESLYQSALEQVRTGKSFLPIDILYKDINCEKPLFFRVWDMRSWYEVHNNQYYESWRTSIRRSDKRHGVKYFLQYKGDGSNDIWFQKAIELNVFNTGTQIGSKKGREYRKIYNIASNQLSAGLILPEKALGRFFSTARKILSNSQDKTNILFSIEPLLAGAAIGLFAFSCFIQTGNRVGEIQQYECSDEGIEIIRLFKFNDDTGRPVPQNSELAFHVITKSKGGRETFYATPLMVDAMMKLFDVRDRYCGNKSFLAVNALNSNLFSYARYYPGKHKFILQWKGIQINRSAISSCINFLLLDHNVLDNQGNPIRLSNHLFRHGFAGLLRRNGMSLDDIRQVLHHANIIISDYYSEETPEGRWARISPQINDLVYSSGLDPRITRSEEEFRLGLITSIKQYGILRFTPGGECGSYRPCPVQFNCASCPDYYPNPDRIDEIDRMIAGCKIKIEIDNANNNRFEAERVKGNLRDWERQRQYAKSIAETRLISPNLDEVLKKLGILQKELVSSKDYLPLLETPKAYNEVNK
jgi:integrase